MMSTANFTSLLNHITSSAPETHKITVQRHHDNEDHPLYFYFFICTLRDVTKQQSMTLNKASTLDHRRILMKGGKFL